WKQYIRSASAKNLSGWAKDALARFRADPAAEGAADLLAQARARARKLEEVSRQNGDGNWGRDATRILYEIGKAYVEVGKPYWTKADPEPLKAFNLYQKVLPKDSGLASAADVPLLNASYRLLVSPSFQTDLAPVKPSPALLIESANQLIRLA